MNPNETEIEEVLVFPELANVMQLHERLGVKNAQTFGVETELKNNN